jgi:hypothetical protein
MRENLAQRQGATVAPPPLTAEWPAAGGLVRGQLIGRVAGAARSIAADLGDRGVHIAVVLSACIAVLATLGAADALVTPLPAFNVDAELDLTKPFPDGLAIIAVFSGCLLFGAALLAFRTATRAELLPWVGIGAFLAFMGVDEVAGVHERVGHLIGTDWQTAYIPIVLAGGVFWLWAMVRMWRFSSERLFWLGGASAWFFAQALEAMTLRHDEGWTLVPGLDVGPGLEETLEMAGSLMFLLALYMVAQRLATREPRLRRHHTRTEQHVELGA